MFDDDNIKDLKKILNGISETQNSYLTIPEADLRGKREDEEFGSYDNDTKTYTEDVRELEKDTKIIELNANKISQLTRKHILWFIKWPLCFCAAIFILMATVGLIVFFVMEIKIVCKLLLASPSELLEIMRSLPKNALLLGGVIAPLSAFTIALTAWLFKAQKK